MDIPRSDPRHAAAQRVLHAMHDFWKLSHTGGAVQWIEDGDGHLVVFTRGEHRAAIREAIGEALQPEQFFELIEDVCEHGIADGDWCPECNAAYKEARRENGDEET